mmetsp:Transcript_43396/g.136010  ORF Transcript_43396/g.136010 Transcript_43396/m.136010 type:complete len:203 (+) Transcript_43396:1374-1982(+)
MNAATSSVRIMDSVASGGPSSFFSGDGDAGVPSGTARTPATCGRCTPARARSGVATSCGGTSEMAPLPPGPVGEPPATRGRWRLSPAPRETSSSPELVSPSMVSSYGAAPGLESAWGKPRSGASGWSQSKKLHISWLLRTSGSSRQRARKRLSWRWRCSRKSGSSRCRRQASVVRSGVAPGNLRARRRCSALKELHRRQVMA